jgi:parvulin-like peptidyl-prolyl isomerase
MKHHLLLLLLFTLTLAPVVVTQEFPNGEIAALVNGETISQKSLLEIVEACYGEGAADSLNSKVIQAMLEEMILFKVMEQNLKEAAITCTAQDYIDSVPHYEQPFLAYFKEWGFKNPVSFVKTLKNIAPNSPEFLKKHGDLLDRLASKYNLEQNDYQGLDAAWNDATNDAKLKKILRKEVFQKYHLNFKVFQEKVKIATKFFKYATTMVSAKEVENFTVTEKFALEGGIVKLHHILNLTIDRVNNRDFTPAAAKKSLERLEDTRKLLKPDASNLVQIARQCSEDEATKFQGGEIGWVPRWSAFTLYGAFLLHIGWIPHWTAFTPELLEEGYRLPEKKVSSPLKTKLGYHLVVVTHRRNGQALSPEELRKKAREQLTFLQMETLLREWLQKSKIERKL